MKLYINWIVIFLAVFLNFFGFFWCFALTSCLLSLTLGFILVVYIQYKDVDQFLVKDCLDNPLKEPHTLGLNFECDNKPIVLLWPNIKVETESTKNKRSGDTRKKSILDSATDLLFKKHSKNIKDGYRTTVADSHQFHGVGPLHVDSVLANKDPQNGHEDRRWKPFETIKIYSDRKKSHDCSPVEKTEKNVQNEQDHIILRPQRGPAPSVKDKSAANKKRAKTILSGNKPIDQIIHTLIEYILRDFIDSWFVFISDNKEFSDIRVRQLIEDSILITCNRIKQTVWLPLFSTKIIDQLANHTRLFRLASQAIFSQQSNTNMFKASERLSPQRKNRDGSHRRNKSDTDLNWFFTNNAAQKTVANSKFYTKKPDEKSLIDPETKLLNAFFDHCDLFKNECMDDAELEKYLTHVAETLLYFTLSEEEFSCLPLRNFLSSILSNMVAKPLIEMFSDPDFINLQMARLFSKDPPPGEFLIKLIRQCTDLSELRACRQLIIKEMDIKLKLLANNCELTSLRYTLKLIDLRISHLQLNKTSEMTHIETDSGNITSNRLPILTLDELLTKQLALSYYLDYLSVLNLQKYVIFYTTAQEWRQTTSQAFVNNQAAGTKLKQPVSKEELYRVARERASDIYNEYLIVTAINSLTLDQGLVEALNIKLKDEQIKPELSWFDSICKYVYEKIKNEDVFLTNFYKSSAYQKLLLELEVVGHHGEPLEIDMSIGSGPIGGLGGHLLGAIDAGSYSNSSNPNLGEDDDEDYMDRVEGQHTAIDSASLSVVTKHARSHSDCTGMVPPHATVPVKRPTPSNIFLRSAPPTESLKVQFRKLESPYDQAAELMVDGSLSARIINTAINCDGQFAVYAVHVSVVEEGARKSWHVYRRYSRFLEMKKVLVRRFSFPTRLPFPAKRAFQNTQRAVLEHRMAILNEFLCEICGRAEQNADMNAVIRDFLEPDTYDRRMHGGAVVRTIESIVTPLRSGMRTIRNMPDTLVGGLSRVLLGRGPMKGPSFLSVAPIPLEQSSEYPALTAALGLLDEVFDLQARSQWLRRGIINRLLGAPWVSHAANRKIVHAAKSLLEPEKIEKLLSAALKAVWLDGKLQAKPVPREDNTRLRTRMAAKISLFALLGDDLKHVLGSETTRSGLLNFFSMIQHQKLNRRLVLIVLSDVLTLLYNTDNVTKHLANI